MTFRLAQPLVSCIPILFVVWWWFRRRKQRPSIPFIKYSDIRLFDGLPTSWRVRFQWLPDALRWTAWGCLVIALARPQTGQNQQIIRGQGIEIVLALDISGSMQNKDFSPQNRLEAAKSVIDTFIQRREFDRIGLVVFAHDAFQLIPPTLDYAVLRTNLLNIQSATEEGIADGTAIGLGISSAANMLRSGNSASKVVILLTDGANNAGDIGPITAAEALATLNIRVYTIGMVQPALATTAAQVDPVDESTLKTVATITKGHYFAASDLADLQNIYDQIDSLERSNVERQIFVRWQEQFLIFAGFGLLLLVVERILRQSAFQAVP
ncbi:MAG: VWA domain-containing protein [Anaerolineaceae bacterium]|nr:VWA domain-containing protein [Anaerolineaceae bacterium]